MSGATTLKNFKPAFIFILVVCFLDVLLNIRYPESFQPILTLLKLAPETFGIILVVWLTVILRIRWSIEDNDPGWGDYCVCCGELFTMVQI